MAFENSPFSGSWRVPGWFAGRARAGQNPTQGTWGGGQTSGNDDGGQISGDPQVPDRVFPDPDDPGNGNGNGNGFEPSKTMIAVGVLALGALLYSQR